MDRSFEDEINPFGAVSHRDQELTNLRKELDRIQALLKEKDRKIND